MVKIPVKITKADPKIMLKYLGFRPAIVKIGGQTWYVGRQYAPRISRVTTGIITPAGPAPTPTEPPVKYEPPTVTPPDIPYGTRTGMMPPPAREPPPQAMLVPYRTEEERRIEARESMRYATPETLPEMFFAPPKPKIYYEEKFGPVAGKVVEFTSASLPAAISIFDPRQWVTPKEDIKISEMSPTMWMHKGVEYAKEEPVKVAGFGAGYVTGALAFGKISSYIGGKLPWRKKEFEVTYWKGTWKTEKGRTPQLYEYVAEIPEGRTAGVQYLDMKTIKKMIATPSKVEYMGVSARGITVERVRRMGSIFDTKVVAKKPTIPDLVLVAETDKSFRYFAGRPDEFIFGRRTVSARVPVEFEKDPFKITTFKGTPRKGDIMREIYPYKGLEPPPKPPKMTYDFYSGLMKPPPPIPSKPPEMKVLTEVGLRPISKAKGRLRYAPIPIGVKEVSYPALFPPGFGPIIGLPSVRETFAFRDISGVTTAFKPMVTEKPKEMLKFDTKIKFKEAPISLEKMGLGFKAKPVTVFKPAVAQKERQFLKFKPALKIREEPIRKPRPIGKPWPFPRGGVDFTFKEQPPPDFGFRPRRRRRVKKKKAIFRKYRYTPTLGGALFLKPIAKAPKILTGLRMRPMIKKRRR